MLRCPSVVRLWGRRSGWGCTSQASCSAPPNQTKPSSSLSSSTKHHNGHNHRHKTIIIIIKAMHWNISTNKKILRTNICPNFSRRPSCPRGSSLMIQTYVQGCNPAWPRWCLPCLPRAWGRYQRSTLSGVHHVQLCSVCTCLHMCVLHIHSEHCTST